MRLNHQTLRRHISVGFQFLHIGNKQHHVEKFIKIFACFCAYRHHDCITAPFLRIELIFACQLCFYAINIRALFVDLVDCNNYFRIGATGEFNRLNRLRHHAVICRHHDNYNIRKRRAVLAKCSKRFVPWRIKQSNRTTIPPRLVCANMLRNTACFTFNYLRIKNCVE